MLVIATKVVYFFPRMKNQSIAIFFSLKFVQKFRRENVTDRQRVTLEFIILVGIDIIYIFDISNISVRARYSQPPLNQIRIIFEKIENHQVKATLVSKIS